MTPIIFIIGLPVYLIAMGWFLYGPSWASIKCCVRGHLWSRWCLETRGVRCRCCGKQRAAD